MAAAVDRQPFTARTRFSGPASPGPAKAARFLRAKPRRCVLLPRLFLRPNVCVFCDGSVHDEPQQQLNDKLKRQELKEKGYRAIVIRYDADLDAQIGQNRDVFGA